MSLEPSEGPEPKKTGTRWLDTILALTAIVISSVSIYVAWHTSHSMEKLVHANSWPFIQLESGNTDEDRVTPVLTFVASNAGTGPAQIRSFHVLVDGQPVQQPNLMVNILRACCREAYQAVIGDSERPYDVIGTVYTRPVAPSLIAPNAQILALAWPQTEANRQLWHAFDQARQTGRISARACFCSVFEECWETQQGSLPASRPACEANAASAPGEGGH